MIASYLAQRSALTEPVDSNRTFFSLARSVEAGEPLYFSDLALVSAKEAPLGGIAESELEKLKGATTRRFLKKGEWLLKEDLHWHSPAALPEGTLAYPVEIENRLSVAPGDRIDLFLTRESGKAARVLVESAQVLERSKAGPGKIVVALASDEIAELETAQGQGSLKMALRNRGGSQAARRFRRVRKSAPVEIWNSAGEG